METIEHNIEKEERLINLLGYHLSGPDASNRWIIWDSAEKNETYGFIQYKKLHGGQQSKGIPKVFGYYMLINSPKIKCGFTRELRGDNYSNEYDVYKLEITNRSKDDVDYVELMMGNHPSIIVRSAKYGYIDFHIDHTGMLCVSFGSSTENYNLKEVIHFSNKENSKYYVYHLEYCKKNHQLSDTNPKWKTTREIRGVEVEKNKLALSSRTWVHGHLRMNEACTVSGTLEEMITMHEMGKDAFKHFRSIIKKIIPGKGDILSKIVTQNIIEGYDLSIFFSDSKKSVNKDKQKALNKSSQI